MKKQYKSKWKLININEKQREYIYSKNRIKANTILKNNHKKEYALILNELINKDYLKILNKFKNKLKGGVKNDN